MFLLDSLLIGGMRFVLDKVAAAADQELNDEDRLREELLAAQMRVELGEMSEEEFAALERDMLARMREIRSAREGESAVGVIGKDAKLRVTGVEATFGGETTSRRSARAEPDRASLIRLLSAARGASERRRWRPRPRGVTRRRADVCLSSRPTPRIRLGTFWAGGCTPGSHAPGRDRARRMARGGGARCRAGARAMAAAAPRRRSSARSFAGTLLDREDVARLLRLRLPGDRRTGRAHRDRSSRDGTPRSGRGRRHRRHRADRPHLAAARSGRDDRRRCRRRSRRWSSGTGPSRRLSAGVRCATRPMRWPTSWQPRRGGWPSACAIRA